MKKIKNLKIGLLLICAFCLQYASAANVSIEPVYGSDRFLPNDVFHATCQNQIDVVFSLDKSAINGISAILEYDNDSIEILKIVWEDESKNNLSYVVNDDKIALNKLKTDGIGNNLTKIKYSIYFKSKTGVDSTRFSIADGSYLVDEKWNMVNLTWSIDTFFEQVPECEPDIKMPRVKLLFPSEKQWTAMDSYFQFDITDEWKWVDKDDIVIRFNGETYDLKDMKHEWEESVLTVYPNFWMPLNTWIELEISVSDRQVYGWANIITKTFYLETPNEIYFLNNIDPLEYREIVNNISFNRWESKDCEYLTQIYLKSLHDWDAAQKLIIENINEKLKCPEFNENDLMNIDNQWKNDLSVFAILWWILFWIAVLIWMIECINKSLVSKH